MPKYINADELRKNIEVDKYGHIVTTINKFRIAVERSVADVVAVVRCKDCKKFKNGICYDENGLVVAGDDDYCSYGERRESE